jgi:hypothetical protein
MNDDSGENVEEYLDDENRMPFLEKTLSYQHLMATMNHVNELGCRMDSFELCVKELKKALSEIIMHVMATEDNLQKK